jgi:hypothetical protein
MTMFKKVVKSFQWGNHQVTMETGEVIGGWWIEHGVGSFGIIQEPGDVTTLQKKKLENSWSCLWRPELCRVI